MKSRSVIRLQGIDRLAFGLLWSMAFNTLVTFRFLENRHLNLSNVNRSIAAGIASLHFNRGQPKHSQSRLVHVNRSHRKLILEFSSIASPDHREFAARLASDSFRPGAIVAKFALTLLRRVARSTFRAVWHVTLNADRFLHGGL